MDDILPSIILQSAIPLGVILLKVFIPNVFFLFGLILNCVIKLSVSLLM